MAEPASTPSSSRVPDPLPGSPGNATQDETPAATAPPTEPQDELAIPTWSAVNAQPVPENASTPVIPAAQPDREASDSAPPPTVAAVAQFAPQAAQPSPEPAQPAKTSLQPDGTDGAMSADVATYGTRSRNRTGNARPNYAEDQEMDFEMTASATAKKKQDAAAPSSTPQTASEAKRARDLLLGGSGTATPTGVNGVKESTPGAASNPSKKRKAAGPPATLMQQTPPASNSPAPSASRKVAPPSSLTARETNVMTFTKHKACLNKKGELTADDGTKLSVNDHVYLVCEPPGEPYYLCRVMEFLHVRSEDPTSPVDALRVNWYYRPRDIVRFNADSRLLYATMHSDICPLTSLRGRCTIKHRSEIEDLESYRKERDSFYFVQVFDRFIRRQYECIPVAQIINVPDKVKKALDERWKFVVVEIGRVKELTSAVKTCKRCTKYCASSDSVDCAICKNSYHMNCVQPPLPKKPSRGFAWACGPCSRASEKKLEARNTPTVSGDVTEAEEDENLDEEIPSASNDTTRAPSPSGDDVLIDDHPATQQEIAMAKMWPMRYLGIHARVEDALQYDDRAIYPRASSRLGPRHQANVPMWHGRPVELVKAAEIKKRYTKNNSQKKEGKLTKETLAALEAEREEKARRPKWVQDQPPGYIPRGEDFDNDDPRNTARMMFTIPEEPEEPEEGPSSGGHSRTGEAVDEFLRVAKLLARDIGVPPFGVNFIDKALELLTKNKFDQEAALKQLKAVHRVKDLHEPVLSKTDLIKFEEGVAKYGSEHRSIRLHMKTSLPHSDIVRFYYLWKKTPKGKEIWGNYGGRKGGSRRRLENDAGALVQQSVANDADDSAFDNDKAIRKNRGFQCKFCNTTHSRQWRRAPGVSPGQTVAADAKSGKEKGAKLLLALCLRCAGLWRKYAIQWEDVDEVAKKVALGGGRAWKRKIDEELLRELIAANEAAPTAEQGPALPSIEVASEPPKKKSKVDEKKERPPPPPKEPTPPPPPIIPAQPTWRALPCAICKDVGDTLSCAHCMLTVHRGCFGLGEYEGVRPDGEIKWICEQCSNDRNPQVSTDYACCLCLTEETQIDFVEPPRVSHKKKTDREREKERLEKELADAMRAEYRNKQYSRHRPLVPREPLKRTTGNNWVHVQCAMWMPEIRFSDAKKFEVAEGFQQIPAAKFEAVCKLCKNRDHQNRLREDKGACVSCFQCHANLHVSCAFEAGYLFGFDVTPVKGSRKDQIITATLADETGAVTAAVWCKEHAGKTRVHPINEIADAETGKTAMQVYAENYKQADLTMTGTVRKANLVQLTREKGQQSAAPTTNGSRRESAANSIAAAVRRGARTSSTTDIREGEDATSPAEMLDLTAERRCVKCKIDVTPKWHLFEELSVVKEATPPKSPQRRMSMTLGEIADLERERSNGDGSRPPTQPEPPRQNIRFMPPGANGRAWQGMGDRQMNGPGPEPQQHGMPPAVNGEGHQNRGPYQSHGPPPGINGRPNAPQEYLCHRCFLKKKLDPTPPPEEAPPPPPGPAPSASPPRSYSLQVGWDGGGQPPPPQPTYEHGPHPPSQPQRSLWDESPRPGQPPPPVNGLGLSNYGPPPTSAPGYHPYGPPLQNGYSTHAGAPSMHVRHNSYGHPAVHHQYGAPSHHPVPLHGLGAPGQQMPNGLTSPRAHPQQHHGPPLLQSPTHHSHAVPPQQQQGHYQAYPPHHSLPPQPPRSNESPFSHLPPMGPHSQQPQQQQQPYSSPSASAGIVHSEAPTSQPQAAPGGILHQQPPQPQHPSTPGQHFGPPPPPSQQTQPQQQFASPSFGGARPSTPQPGATPASTSAAGGGGQAGAVNGAGSGVPGSGSGNGVGASASPSLRNLLS